MKTNGRKGRRTDEQYRSGKQMNRIAPPVGNDLAAECANLRQVGGENREAAEDLIKMN